MRGTCLKPKKEELYGYKSIWFKIRFPNSLFDLFSQFFNLMMKYYMGFLSALYFSNCLLFFEAGNNVCPARMNNGRRFLKG